MLQLMRQEHYPKKKRKKEVKCKEREQQGNVPAAADINVVIPFHLLLWPAYNYRRHFLFRFLWIFGLRLALTGADSTAHCINKRSYFI